MTPTATERAALVEMARDLARGELAPRATALDDADPAALAHCRGQLAAIGLDRALLREEHGGAGLAPADLLPAIEELAAGDGGMAMCVLLSNAALVALGPARAGELAEDERWVLVTARPGEVGTSGGRVDGHLASALGAHEADGVVLLASGPQPAVIALGCSADGVVLEADEAQMGLRAAPAASITLRGVHAPGEVESAGHEAALALLRAGTAAIARGIARHAYEMAL